MKNRADSLLRYSSTSARLLEGLKAVLRRPTRCTCALSSISVSSLPWLCVTRLCVMSSSESSLACSLLEPVAPLTFKRRAAVAREG